MKYHVVRRTTAAVCRSPCGERGLKFRAAEEATIRGRRSPCGERGLKFRRLVRPLVASPSLPVRGAWIEIFYFV